MSEPFVVKCPLCGKLYKFVPYNVVDQSACPDCVRKAEENMKEMLAR